MPKTLHVVSDSVEQKVPITRMVQKPMPTEEEFIFVSRMANEAILNLRKLQAAQVKNELAIQAALKDVSLWESERWHMRMTLNRWNRTGV